MHKPSRVRLGGGFPLFDLDTITVARLLVGYGLYVANPDGSLCGGSIVETEGYLADDEASHAFRGRTPRNASMFLPAGHAYVYRSYGIHWCFNVVTAAAGVGEAVLIRALEPRRGIREMYRRRGLGAPPAAGSGAASADALGGHDGLLRDTGTLDRRLTNGPGKLCQALGITGEFDGRPLEVRSVYGERMFVEHMSSTDNAERERPRVVLIRESHEGFEVQEGSIGGARHEGREGPDVIVGPRVGISRAVDRPYRFRRAGSRWTGR